MFGDKKYLSEIWTNILKLKAPWSFKLPADTRIIDFQG